ncbi:MAG: thymidine phosphorylase [Thermoplasmata archaeon]|nr:thymidine phosphorylase [Thermoplasmata archaeon]
MPTHIQEMVNGVVDGTLTDSQVEDWLRDIFDNGLSSEETVELTHAMLHSGMVIKWPKEIAHLIVDKHSTGGVGDKVSLPLAPALAACGAKVPMISGRGLGFTGGTLDKLESLPNYTVGLTPKQLQSQIEDVGCAIAGQTGDIAPADKRMYAIRDITGLIASVPLVTGSIISKKAAAGLNALVMDVKVGKAAFMKNEDDARELANSMASTGQGLGMKTSVTLTKMDTPIGYAIGNSLEVLESIETLRGNGPSDLEELVCVQGGILLAAANLVEDEEIGALAIHDSLHDGTALSKFEQMCISQGVSSEIFQSEHSLMNALGLLDESLKTTELSSEKSGFVSDINALELAMVSSELGAGRKRIDDVLDMQVGLLIDAHIGYQIDEGETWITVYHREKLSEDHIQRINNCLTLSQNSIKDESRIIDIL